MRICILLTFCLLCQAMYSQEPKPVAWWSDAVEKQLARAGQNRPELEKSLHAIPKEERAGMEFLVTNMPDSDLQSLHADFLISNHYLAYKARKELPWGNQIPEEIFLNHVLPYANVDEKREAWRREFYDLCIPIIKECKTPSEATQKLNSELFKKLKLKYAPQKRAPNLSPSESIEQGTASCTGLSIVLCDACRSIGVPARLVGTPNWFDKRGNHTWVEVWDKGWHFTGACEPDPKGLDRGWFVGDASKAQKDEPEHAIYAASFRKTGLHFPLIWARGSQNVSAENITERYAKSATSKNFRLSLKVLGADKKRIATLVIAHPKDDADKKLEGKSRDESADLNDFLTFELQPQRDYVIRAGSVEKTITCGKAGEHQLMEIQLK